MITTLMLPAPASADAPICNAPGLAIPDGAGEDIPGPTITDTIAVSDGGTILDLNLAISTTHPYVGDLVFTLTHNVGAPVTSTIVISRPLFGNSAITTTAPPGEPACTGNNINVILDDEGVNGAIQIDCNEGYFEDDPVEAYLPFGSYQPFSPLNIFDTGILTDVWELAVSDHFEDDIGTLNGWCLIPTTPPDLEINADDGGASVIPGGTVAYNLTYIANFGTADNVVITETVPANTTFNAGASTAGWSCTDGDPAGTVCTRSVGNLVNGSGGSVIFAVNLPNPVSAGLNQISNSASIGDDGTYTADRNSADNSDSDTTPVNAAPNLQISKRSSATTITAGGTITYTLTYTNAGNQAATGVIITETVPNNTTFNPAASTPGWNCTPNNNAGSSCTLNIGSLAGGNTGGSATFVVTVDDPLPAGVTTITNSAQIGDDGQNGDDSTPADNQDDEPVDIDDGSLPRIFLPIVLKN
jgi:uncharacterized repeat protein (TIGR01451 family)